MTIPVHFRDFSLGRAASRIETHEICGDDEPIIAPWPFPVRLLIVVAGAVLAWLTVLAPALWILARHHA